MVYLPGCTLEQQLDFYRQGASEVFDALPDVRLLAAKCKALYRVRVFEQNREHQELVMKQGPLCLYPQGRKVTLEGKELSLTPKEYDLLCICCRTKTRCSRASRLWKRCGATRLKGACARWTRI